MRRRRPLRSRRADRRDRRSRRRLSPARRSARNWCRSSRCPRADRRYGSAPSRAPLRRRRGEISRLPWRKSPCTSVWRLRACHARLQPLERELEHRMRIVVEHRRCRDSARNCAGPSTTGKHGAQSASVSTRVDAREDLAALPRELRAHRVEFLVAQDLARDGFARQPVHHIALADAVLRLQHIAHARRRDAGRARRLR